MNTVRVARHRLKSEDLSARRKILHMIRDLRYLGSPDFRSLYVKVASKILLQSFGDADASPSTCDNRSDRALQTFKPRNVLNRDPSEGRLDVIEATSRRENRQCSWSSP